MMPSMVFKSNIEQLTGNLIHRFSELAIDYEAMALEIQSAVGAETIVRAELEVAPSFNLWKPNNPIYAARKGNLPIGILTGEMLSEDNLRGRITQADSNAIRLDYKGTEFAINKLTWFEAGGRKVWGLDQYVRPKVTAIVKAFVDSSVKSSVKVSQVRFD